MRYSLLLTVDLLDKLARGEVPSQPELVRGTIALALHSQAGGDEMDLSTTIQDLEMLALGQIAGLDEQARHRASTLAAILRRAVGVH